MSLGYRPSIPRIQKDAVEQSLFDNLSNVTAAVDNYQKAAADAAAVKPDELTVQQLVDISKREEISATELDASLTAIYNIAENLGTKADAASDLIAKSFKPVTLDKEFKENTKQDALLIFGKEIDQLSPNMLKCLNKITMDSSDLVGDMERGDPSSTAETREKFTDLSSIDRVLDKIRVSAPKFGFEFLLLLILIMIEEIIKLILAPICQIKIGSLLATAIAVYIWFQTRTIVDVRDVCDCMEDPTPECADKYNDGVHVSIAKRWDDMGPTYFRGETPGFPTGDILPPICEDTNPERKPNLFETQAALNIIREFKNQVARKSGDIGTRDDYETMLAFMNTDAAKHSANTIKLSAGNMQDTVRLSASGGAGINASLSVQGVSPGAQFAKTKFGSGVTKTLNQMLQNLKAIDNMIKSATSLAFLDSKLADMVCCFIRLLFNYAVYLSKTDTTNNSFETSIKAFFKAAPDRPFGDMEKIFKEVTEKSIQADFNKIMKNTTAYLANDPKINAVMKDVLKSIKLLEAIVSAISSSISADLNFGVSLDIKKLREAMLGVVGKTMTVAVDVLMSEIRIPTEDFIRQITEDPRWSLALKECELFTIMSGMLVCGIDGLDLTIRKMLEIFQRDTDAKWLQINAGMAAAYNQKMAKFITDIINIIMNDIYLLFTICNIDTIYKPEDLKDSSINVANSLGVDKQIKLLTENQETMKKIYEPLFEDLKVGALGTEVADKAFTGASLGFTFSDPLKNTLSPLMAADFQNLDNVPVETSDGPLQRKYNTTVPVDPVAAIMDKLADRDCIRCSTTDFISVPIVERFNRNAYRGYT